MLRNHIFGTSLDARLLTYTVQNILYASYQVERQVDQSEFFTTVVLPTCLAPLMMSGLCLSSRFQASNLSSIVRLNKSLCFKSVAKLHKICHKSVATTGKFCCKSAATVGGNCSKSAAMIKGTTIPYVIYNDKILEKCRKKPAFTMEKCKKILNFALEKCTNIDVYTFKKCSS